MIGRWSLNFWLVGALSLALSAVISAPAQAQAWASKEFCTITDPQIDPTVFTFPDYATMQAEAALIPNSVGKFWKITAPSGAESHLWGTMHVADPLILAFPPEVEKAIKSARVIMPEFDFRYKSRLDVTLAFTWHGIGLNPHQPSARVDMMDIDPRVEAAMYTRLEATGWGRGATSAYKPATIVEILLGDPCNDFTAGIPPIQDAYLQSLGIVAGADIKGLEPADALEQKLNAPDAGELVRAIITIYGTAFIEQPDNRFREASFALYLTGQSGLWDLWGLRGSMAYFGEEEGRRLSELAFGYLIDERNVTFAKAAAPELDKGGAFVAVGLGHLAGEAGLIELLRARGYTVERVPLPGELP